MPPQSLPDPCIVRVALPLPLHINFDYLVPDSIPLASLQIGLRLRVPFGKEFKIGILLGFPQSADVAMSKLKYIDAVLDIQPLLSTADLTLLQWASRYYYHPLGEVVCSALPGLLRKGGDASLPTYAYYQVTPKGADLDPATLKRALKQQALLSYLQSCAPNVCAEADLAAQFPGAKSQLKTLIAKDLVSCEYLPLTSPAVIEHTRSAPLTANPAQQLAIDSVCQGLGQFAVFLLEGVTGSGKTEVYMQIISAVLAAGQQVLVLLPEITLTPQLEARFKQRFAVSIAVSHSKLSDLQRQNAWLAMQQGDGKILLGTRSALFTPLQNPGLIILDEEHDSSFKQQEGFRFSTRDVAIMRAKQLHLPVLLGSATPALESVENAARQRYQYLALPARAGSAIAPQFLLLDIRNKALQEGLSEPLIKAIRATLAKNEQVLIFINRRGFAPTLICHSCAWVARCLRCDANLVTHFDKQVLRCHHCGHEQALVKQCPSCEKASLTPLGLGTERVEKVLQNLFPNEPLIRLDQDTTQRKGSLEHYLAAIERQEVKIILGTQMLAKGHHFPNVTLVALLDVDSGLFSIDYRAPEKLAQLIVQVAGRAGRAEKPGRVILQTRQPEHPLLVTLIREGYQNFAKMALAERKAACLPPFSHQALFRALAMQAQAPQDFLKAVCHLLGALASTQGILILGPVAAPMTKKAGRYHYQLLLQAKRRSDLRAALDQIIPQLARLPEAKKVRWSVDIDPVDLY